MLPSLKVLKWILDGKLVRDTPARIWHVVWHVYLVDCVKVYRLFPPMDCVIVIQDATEDPDLTVLILTILILEGLEEEWSVTVLFLVTESLSGLVMNPMKNLEELGLVLASKVRGQFVRNSFKTNEVRSTKFVFHPSSTAKLWTIIFEDFVSLQ